MGRPKKAPKAEVTSDERSIFLNLLDKYKDAKDQAADAKEVMGACLEAAKASGFLKEDFEFAISLGTEQEEKTAKAKIRRRLFIARLMDKALGDQLELFTDPVPVAVPESPVQPGVCGFVPFSAEELDEQRALAEEASKH